jgi:hypothetical protein
MLGEIHKKGISSQEKMFIVFEGKTLQEEFLFSAGNNMSETKLLSVTRVN